MKKNDKRGFTLIEMLVSTVIIVLLAVGISTGINAAMRAYKQSVFKTECSTLSDIINTSIGDILRYSEIDMKGKENEFFLTNYDYNIRNASFSIVDTGEVEGSGGQIALTYKKGEDEEGVFYIVNDGAYAQQLKVTALDIKAKKAENNLSNKYYFEVNYTVESTKNPELKKNYSFRVRQANADVVVIDDHEEQPPTDTPETGEFVTVTYDSNVPESINSYVIKTFWGHSRTFIQTIDPSVSTVLHFLGADDMNCDWYTLKSWNTVKHPTESNPGSVYEPGKDRAIRAADINDGMVTLYAQWEPTEYTLKYCFENGTKDNDFAVQFSVDPAIKLSDNKITLHQNANNVRKEVYDVTFDGNSGTVSGQTSVRAIASQTKWTNVSGAASSENEKTFALGSEQTLTDFAENFDSFKPSDKGSTITLYAKWGDAKVTIPEAERTDWTFNGWSEKEAVSSGFVLPGERTVTKDTTFYAQYKTTLNFFYKSNEIERTYFYGCGIDEPTENESGMPAGYHIVWYADENFKIPFSENLAKTGTKSFYAEQKPNTYTVIFNGNDHTGGSVPEDQKFTYGGKKQLTPEDYTQITKDGWTFDGWSKEQYAGKDNVVYADNYDESFISTEYEGYVTLYARWKCDVDYDLNGGTETAAPVDYYYGTTTLSLPQPTRTGYSFDGWFTAASGGTELTNDTVNNYIKDHGETTLYAQWTINKYTVNLDLSNAKIKHGQNGAEFSKNGENYEYGSTVVFYVNFEEDGERSITVTDANGNTIIGEQDEEEEEEREYSFTMPAADVTIKASSTNNGCVTGDTLITMADGTQKQLRNITPGEEVLVFNHETGRLDTAPLDLIVHYGAEQKTEKVWHLLFDDGTAIRIIKYHGFFDLTLNEYVYIKPDNYEDFYGHEFYSLTAPNHRTKFVKAYCATETTDYYAPITKEHLNLFANGMLTMTSSMEGLFNIFELDENMKYDTRKMNADIQKYGLYSYDDFKAYIPYEIYDYFPAPYLKVAVGKGNITFEHIIELAKKFCYEALAPEDVSDASVSH